MAVYSYSRLETFETCPLQYKFHYVDKIRKEEEAIELFLGSRVHEVLEKLYKDLVLGRLNTLEQLLAFYRSEWNKQWGAQVIIRDPNFSAQDYLGYGEQCIRNYYDDYQPFRQSRTLGTEVELRFALDRNHHYQMLGYIDRVAQRADGTYEIHDYKTSRSVPSQQDADHDRQLGLYHLGLQARWRDVERVELLWHYVGFGKTLGSQRVPEQLQELREETIGVIDRIERERAFEPCKGAWCAWCQYRAECPLWKHVEAVAKLSAREFAAEDGVRLANEYAGTKLEIDRLEERLGSLRETILQFAREKQVRVLQGSGVRVGVKFQEKTKFPGAGDPLRSELEDVVRASGRWDEASSLNTNALAQALEEKKWPPSLLEQLRKFATAAETATVTVKRTGEAARPD